jgi:hypothetical protein
MSARLTHRQKVMAFIEANDCRLIEASRYCIDIDFPDGKQCVNNGFHSLYYPDLKDSEMRMADIWRDVWFDLENGLRDCPSGCDCGVGVAK